MHGIRSHEQVQFCQFISPYVRGKVSPAFRQPRASLIHMSCVDVHSKACVVATYRSAHRQGEFFKHEFFDPALISRDWSQNKEATQQRSQNTVCVYKGVRMCVSTCVYLCMCSYLEQPLITLTNQIHVISNDLFVYCPPALFLALLSFHLFSGPLLSPLSLTTYSSFYISLNFPLKKRNEEKLRRE